MRRELVIVAALAAVPAWAQMFGDWSEGDVPQTPALRTQDLIPIQIEGSQFRFGVDPASVSVGKDGVVRYVLVAQSPAGTVNAFYEGVHCSRATFRLYARYSPSGWRNVESEWQPLNESMEGRHAFQVAKSGVCAGRAPAGNAAQVVQSLKTRPDLKSGV